MALSNTINSFPIFQYSTPYQGYTNQPQLGNLLYQAVMPGPVATEKLSSFFYKLHQPIAQQQKSPLKDTTHFINFLEKTKVQENKILLSMDIRSLYTNIPQEERISGAMHTKHFMEMNLLSLHDYYKERSNLS